MTTHETWLYCKTAEAAAELRTILRKMGFKVHAPDSELATAVRIACDRFNQTAYAESGASDE